MSYIILSNITFSIFFVLYMAFFRRLTFFHWNRAYLIFAVVFSAIAPFIRVPQLAAASGDLPLVELPAIVVNGSQQPSLSPIISIASWIYWFGVLVGLIMLAKGVISLVRLKHKSRLEASANGNYLEGEGNHAFSFFGTIQIGERIDQEVRDMIVTHEKIHVNQWHSVDVIIYSVARVFAWFNPFIHLAAAEVKLNHEYLADQATQNAFGRDYQHSLLNQALDTKVFQLTNSFYSKSIIKNRILMMNNSKSRARSLAIYALTVPAVAATIWLSACSQQTGLPDSEQKEIGLENAMKPASDEVFDVQSADVAPEFPGGKEQMMAHFGENFKYPEALKEEGVEGKVFISFIVNEDGTLSNFEHVKADDERLIEPAKEFLMAMPAWTPGMKDGKNVKFKMVLPVQYALN